MSKNTPIHQRDRAPDIHSQRSTAIGISTLLIADRSTPQAGLGGAYAVLLLASPALWRWRKYAVFPHGRVGVRK